MILADIWGLFVRVVVTAGRDEAGGLRRDLRARSCGREAWAMRRRRSWRRCQWTKPARERRWGDRGGRLLLESGGGVQGWRRLRRGRRGCGRRGVRPRRRAGAGGCRLLRIGR